jgi:hypothetical protein
MLSLAMPESKEGRGGREGRREDGKNECDG